MATKEEVEAVAQTLMMHWLGFEDHRIDETGKYMVPPGTPSDRALRLALEILQVAERVRFRLEK